MILNDIPVGRKLFIIYFTGVLIPLLIINGLILSRVQKTLTEQYRSGNHAIMERAAARFTTATNNGRYVLQKFYSDRGIYRILNTDYRNDLEFVNVYNGLFNSTVLTFLPFYEDLSNFMLYTTNPTILNGGSIRYADSRIREQPWYLSPDDPQKFSLVPWIGSNQEDNRQDLHISLIYPLNYYTSFDRYYHFMKADLKLASLEALFEELTPGAALFLTDREERIILSSPSRESWAPLSRMEADSKGTYILEKSIAETGNPPWTLIGYFPVKRKERARIPADWLLPLTGLILLLNSSFLIFWVSRSLTVRLNRLTGHIRIQEGERMTILDEGPRGPGKDEIGGLIESFNQMSRRINQLVHDVYASELANREMALERKNAELHALQSQINPHYLFNTLETIRMKSILKGEDETAEILQLLSSSFRRMFTWGDDLIPLEDSLQFLEEYLIIQRYRLGERFTYRISCPSELKERRVPKFLIQPLVENSCRHGFKGESRAYRLNIDIDKVYDCLQVSVEDNGMGMEEDFVSELQEILDSKKTTNRFVGLRNVRSRLRARYGEGLFKVISRPGTGTRVIFQIGSGKGEIMNRDDPSRWDWS